MPCISYLKVCSECSGHESSPTVLEKAKPSRILVATPLPRLQMKREMLWEELASLLTRGVMETIQLSWEQG